MSLIGAIFAALFNALAGLWRGRQQDQDAAAAHERAGAAEAGNETTDVIAETADARANLPAEPTDPDALAARLHDKARARAGGSGTDDSA